ncbi:HD domain-containing protein [Candidatus Tisiphia endosymbiont of Dioctria rufipes]|uniref:HD domain-containing protein n=1 Tax=Candidatus Tisiphia endosymbiont of Dioctria rufipes TaxID=3066255 RepID=UPI00312C787A
MDDISCWQSKFQSCYYSDRLLDKLLKLNNRVNRPIDIDEVTKAIYYARKYHAEQMRQSGEPYYSHPIEVAYLLAEYAADNAKNYFRTDLTVTSILHDCLEDTKLTKSMIASIFGELIAGQVDDLTRVKPNRKISSAEMVELLYKEKKYDVLVVKIFDRFHNLQTIEAKSPEKAKKIILETISRFMSLSIYLRVPVIEQILLELHARITQKQVDNQYYNNFLLPSLISQNTILQLHNLLS